MPDWGGFLGPQAWLAASKAVDTCYKHTYMNRFLLQSAALVLAVAWLLPGGLAQAQPAGLFASSSEGQMRTLTGIVRAKNGGPLPDAVVYLKNTSNLAVKTYIAEKDGRYRFNALSPNTDYEVYAEHQGKRSSTKTVSGFDNREKVVINLEIDMDK